MQWQWTTPRPSQLVVLLAYVCDVVEGQQLPELLPEALLCAAEALFERSSCGSWPGRRPTSRRAQLQAQRVAAAAVVTAVVVDEQEEAVGVEEDDWRGAAC